MIVTPKPVLRALAILGLVFAPLASAQTTTAEPAQRLIVLTDIEADPDDTQSLIRLLLYANEIDIEGLIATTSVHQKTRVAPESIRAVLDTYEHVRPNLETHAAGYPTGAALKAITLHGLPEYGMGGVGAGKDSEGSDWIIHVLEQDDDRPVWVSVWGGANTLAQALHKIRRTHSKADAARLVAKLRVYTISDQDDSGIWIRRNFPDLFYIVSPGGYGGATWTAINAEIPGFDNHEISNAWLAGNIQQGHGVLGARYPDVAYGMEGDTPAYLALIPNGLNAPEHPDWGGWGGRYELYRPDRAALDPDGFTGGVPVEAEPRAIWTNASDQYVPLVAGTYGRATHAGSEAIDGNKATLWRWRKDIQNDFAARMDWTTQPFGNANHPPVPVLGHADTLTVKSGSGFTLDATPTTDPDGDSLSYVWFNYPEAGTLDAPVPIDSAENIARVHVVAPDVTTPSTLHFILRVTDKGSPPLARYKRVIVTVLPD
ncbi:DUF1593 domain-containing protein [Hyphomonas johnsonii]|uniref:DUF1593 domain-containing protein n=1 Tax=Hyphomonas johnsonii MHS-2 TaxID=1280950 RepID=A0A059FJH7_9PROT|nr:DUF1593 domain-containing protein [Hyphomonas johnsonii]KCZ90686.1 hypothetical protein HJO_12581 [Hyphomonas johnsonii MHS-2]